MLYNLRNKRCSSIIRCWTLLLFILCKTDRTWFGTSWTGVPSNAHTGFSDGFQFAVVLMVEERKELFQCVQVGSVCRSYSCDSVYSKWFSSWPHTSGVILVKVLLDVQLVFVLGLYEVSTHVGRGDSDSTIWIFIYTQSWHPYLQVTCLVIVEYLKMKKERLLIVSL